MIAADVRVSRSTPPHRLVLLAGIFAAAFTVRIIYLVEGMDNPSFWVPIVDAGAYDTIARQLATAGELSPRLFWQPFFYPTYLSLIYWLSGGSLLAAKILQAGLGAATCCLVFVLGRRLVDRRTGVLAAVITALYGPLILFEGEMLATGWAAFWAVLLVLLFSVAGDRLTPTTGLALGAAAAFGLLTRPSFLPFLVAGLLWLLMKAGRGDYLQRDIRSLAVACLAFLALVAPVAVLSQRTTGHFGFLPGSGGLNAYIGNNPRTCETLSVRPGLEWGELLDLPADHDVDGYAARNRFFYSEVARWASTDPLAFGSGLVGKTLRILSSRELPRNIDVYLYRRWSALQRVLSWKVGGFGFPFGLLLPLAVVGLVRLNRRLGWPLLLCLALYPLSIVAVFVAARYRVPMVPLLSIPAAGGLLWMVDGVAGRHWARLGADGVMMAGALAIAVVPGPFCEERLDLEADFYYCLGHAQGERGDAEGSLASYRRALEVNPDLDQVRYNVGLILQGRGDPEEAAQHYEKALQIDPGFARAQNNLGSVRHQQGRPGDAVEHFAEAVWLEPRWALPRRNLAKVLLELRRYQEAVPHLETVRELEPGVAEDHFLVGSALLQAERLAEAVEELRRAVELDDAARYRNELGTALLGIGSIEEALAEFRAAIDQAPEYCEAYNNAGATLAILGDPKAARDYFEKALACEPDYVDARYNLTTMLLRLGEPVQARTELEAILKRQPDHAAALRRLEALRPR